VRKTPRWTARRVAARKPAASSPSSPPRYLVARVRAAGTNPREAALASAERLPPNADPCGQQHLLSVQYKCVRRIYTAQRNQEFEMYIKKIEIEDFKCFCDTSALFNHQRRQKSTPYSNINLIVGENGSGKTSLFRAISAAFLSPIVRSIGMNLDFMARRPINKQITNTLPIKNIEYNCYVKIYVNLEHDSSDIEYLISFRIDTDNDLDILRVSSLGNISPSLDDETHPTNSFFVAYGANRRMGRPEGFDGLNRNPIYQRVISIFEEHVSLIPFTLGFLELSESGQLDQATEILNSLLPNDVQLTKERDDQKRPLFRVKNTSLLPVTALSDGYRIFISWIWDMFYHMDTVTRKSENKDFREIEGVVIVDEIDLFMHPEWQRTVIDSLAKMFPKIQFFFSTHSPIVTGTVQPENIYVMEEEADGSTVIKQYSENVYGLTPNQILTSSYFGLESTRAPGTGTLVDMVRREKSGIDILDEISAEIAG
jgi:energy-coupling factor transporter ATP-binding protein EcfA2